MTIGDKIKSLRKDCRLTQEELATKVGTRKQTIFKYENGIVTNIPATKIKSLADALGTTPAYLMGWNESPSPNKEKRSSILTAAEGSSTDFFPLISNEEQEHILKYRALTPDAKSRIDNSLDFEYKALEKAIIEDTSKDKEKREKKK